MNIQPSIDLKKVNLQTAVGYLVSLHENEYQWNLLGVKVIGVAPTEADIPEGTYEYGDAYEVGTEPPYDLYIYTRPDGKVHTEGYWFNTGKFPMPGPKGPKGDGVETFTGISLTHDIFSGDVYGSDNGQMYNGMSTIKYKDSTTGQTKSQKVYTTVFLPIVGSDYINIDGDYTNNRFVVRLDDTALAQDYIKLDKTKNSVIPEFFQGKIQWDVLTTGLGPNTVVQRAGDNSTFLAKLYVNELATTANDYNMPLQAAYYGGFSDGFTVEKTTTDTGTLTAEVLEAIKSYPNAGLKYNNQSYIRMDPVNAPDGTLNFIHIDSIDDDNGGHKAIVKCFSITVNTRAWQMVTVNLAKSYSHQICISNQTTNAKYYFTLINNDSASYQGNAVGLINDLSDTDTKFQPATRSHATNGIAAALLYRNNQGHLVAQYGTNTEQMTANQLVIWDQVV